MGKLVQDQIPGILGAESLRIAFAQADPAQRRNLLFAKLLEEAGEWLTATTPEHRHKELVDMQMLLRALAELDDIDPGLVLADAVEKLTARGGYDQLTVMTVEGADTAPVTREIRSQPAWIRETPEWAPGAPRPEPAQVPAPTPIATPTPRPARDFHSFDGPGYSG